MKVIYITSSLPFGTGESFVLTEIRSLIEKGIEIKVIPVFPRGEVVHDNASFLMDDTSEQSLLNFDIIIACIKILKVDFYKCISIFGKVIFASDSLKNCLKNLLIFPKSLWIVNLARESKVDHIHAHWMTTPSTCALIAGDIADIPWSVTAHRGDIVEKNALALKWQKASFIRFISVKSLHLAMSICKKKICGNEVVLHMGVALNKLSEDNSVLITSHQRFTILCAGNLLPVKGHQYLIDAIKILRDKGMDIRLMLAGSGYLENNLRSQVSILKLDDIIEFVGHLPHEKLLNLYEQKLISIFVLPSIDLGNGIHEGIPVSLIEAMSYSIPVISTNTGGIPELLKDEAGIVVPDKDPTALSQAINLLIDDEIYRDKLILNAQKRINDEFDIEKTSEKLIFLFQSNKLVSLEKIG